jgi:hypothetical protein
VHEEQKVRKVAILAIAVICLLIGSTPLYAIPNPQQEQSQCLIVSPASGSQIRGQVTIQGSATHPNFTWYQIGYAPDPNPSGEWKFFFSSETAVGSSQLALWDTTAIEDGTYQLLLEVHRNDGNHDLCFATKLRVNNSAPTPTFTAPPLPTAANTPTPLPTPEDTATVLVDQPPTATPRATPTYSSVDNPTPTPEQTRLRLPIDPGGIRDASCRGAQVTVLIAVVVVVYFLVRNLAVSGVRKVRKPKDVQGFHRRKPREF